MQLNHIITAIEKELSSYDFGQNPSELYDPIRYILALGGKRLRPALCCMAYELYQQDITPSIKPAIAIEVFHNFTLVHDDIMDEAPLRRGNPTVHTKWNQNIAILSGDVMLVKAYDLLLSVEQQYLAEVIQLFNICAAEVCEGQQYDMNFEEREDVSREEYIEMIRLKTAVLLGYSLESGAVIAGASDADKMHLKQFGQKIGIAFQLQDDILDVYGDQEKFGKQVGGDIISNKKTLLLISALEKAEGKDKTALNEWISATEFVPEEKVAAVTAIYNQLGIRTEAESLMQQYLEEAMNHLNQVDVQDDKKENLKAFAQYLIARDN